MLKEVDPGGALLWLLDWSASGEAADGLAEAMATECSSASSKSGSFVEVPSVGARPLVASGVTGTY